MHFITRIKTRCQIIPGYKPELLQFMTECCFSIGQSSVKMLSLNIGLGILPLNMGQNPSGISSRIDRARLAQDLSALEELIEATPGRLHGASRVLAFQLMDTIDQGLKRHNIYADARLELSIAVRAIPPWTAPQALDKPQSAVVEIYHTQARESIAYLRSMLEDRCTAQAV